jgi:hypothetical protein
LRLGKRELAERLPSRSSPASYAVKMHRIFSTEGQNELAENKDGISISMATVARICVGEKTTLLLKVLSETRHVLRQVGIVSGSSAYTFAGVNTVVLCSDYLPRYQLPLKWRWNEDHADVRVSIGALYNGWTGLELRFECSSDYPGVFRQWVVFDFGSMMIGRKLEVIVTHKCQRPFPELQLLDSRADIITVLNNNQIQPLLHWLSLNIHEEQSAKEAYLWHAVVAGNAEAVALLVKAQVNPAIVDGTGCTPMHVAARHGHNHVLELLMSAASDRDPVDFDGCSPLYDAIEHNHLSTVESLYRLGANMYLP